MFAPSARIFQEVLHRVLEAADFPKAQRNGKERTYVRFHDLRHTFASHGWPRAATVQLEKILVINPSR